MTGLRYLLAGLIAGIVLNQALRAQDSAAATATNMRVYQSLAASLSDSLAGLIPGGDSPRVAFHVSPGDVAWFLQDAVERPFRSRHIAVAVNDSARYVMDFGAEAMKVHYANLRRSGIFGSRVLDRTVVLQASLRLVDRTRGTIVMTGERTQEYSDTVELSQVEGLEHAAVPSTRGALPAEDFFSGIAEPLVIVGAVAVAIFLLFTVRS